MAYLYKYKKWLKIAAGYICWTYW